MTTEKYIKITMFPAGAGDCILIEFLKEDYRVLIDGGYADTYRLHLKKYLLKLSEEGKRINLLIISHIDADHIGGIQKFLEENISAEIAAVIKVDEVWYNAFFHMNKGTIQSGPIPYTLREVLCGSIASQNTQYSDGQHDISVKQGNTVAGLLWDGEYNWNTSWSGKAVCIENGIQKELTDRIRCTLLAPDKNTLQGLAQLWVSKLKNKIRNVAISNDCLYSEAFECDVAKYHGQEEESVKMEIGYNAFQAFEKNDWKQLSESWNGQIDSSPTNCSSIAILLEYEGRLMLFPGDCPLQLFRERLPAQIDIVKLPHHGSEKNITKDFIDNTEVFFYLLSTEGKIHGHPSKSVVGSILCKEGGKQILQKNYNIIGFEEVGFWVRDGYEY